MNEVKTYNLNKLQQLVDLNGDSTNFDLTFNAVAKNSIGERMYASPAISNGKIYLRGFQHLFCIGSKQ
jgi:hypothetical protein